MNIFVVNYDPKQAAREMCDKHVIKCCLESTQILSTVIRALVNHDGILEEMDSPLYKPTHKNHPSTLWAFAPPNYKWLLEHAQALSDEYTYRFGKVHGCQKVLDWIWQVMPPYEHAGFPERFEMVMPDVYKTGDAVESYRRYYVAEKSHLFKWTRREQPQWIEDYQRRGMCEAAFVAIVPEHMQPDEDGMIYYTNWNPVKEGDWS